MDYSVTEVEADVVDKLKYIEETKETMAKNTKKLAELMQDISGIQTGKKRLGNFTGANTILCVKFEEFKSFMLFSSKSTNRGNCKLNIACGAC